MLFNEKRSVRQDRRAIPLVRMGLEVGVKMQSTISLFEHRRGVLSYVSRLLDVEITNERWNLRRNAIGSE
ncbi:hypothetical protein GD3902_10825 [Geobacillus thermodenitrificans]|nr:hypothetical protein GD3902_10825 [Geobacillus thermodenitrificans]